MEIERREDETENKKKEGKERRNRSGSKRIRERRAGVTRSILIVPFSFRALTRSPCEEQ